jgi:chromosome segregation and condensation protein ScpB
MFRLFRRRKKEDVKMKKVSPEVTPSISEESPVSTEDLDTSTKSLFEIKEQTFEEKFAKLVHISPELSIDESESPEAVNEILPFIQHILDQNSTYSSFISPEIISSGSETLIQEIPEDFPSLRKEIQPASLAERIEGALFSVGRPIHTSELIENFEEDSPTIKRMLRKVSRKRRKSSAIVIEEISKERWVMQLNPVYHEFFQSIKPEFFLQPAERRVLTEIAYRQPISLGLLKKIITGIGPIKINEICQKLESNGFVLSEQKARSKIYISTPKFAKSFGFDAESRRLKLQMLWRLKRLMGEYEDDEEPEEELDDKKAEALVEDDESIEKVEGIQEEIENGESEKEKMVLEDTSLPENSDTQPITPIIDGNDDPTDISERIWEIGEEE